MILNLKRTEKRFHIWLLSKALSTPSTVVRFVDTHDEKEAILVGMVKPNSTCIAIDHRTRYAYIASQVQEKSLAIPVMTRIDMTTKDYENQCIRYGGEIEVEGVPENLLPGLRRYRDEHVPTGHFLQRVLENDLAGAVSHGDPWSLQALHPICMWIWANMPADCFGSKEIVASWIAEGIREKFVPREESKFEW